MGSLLLAEGVPQRDDARVVDINALTEGLPEALAVFKSDPDQISHNQSFRKAPMQPAEA
jgi:hypothetical protein